MAGVLISGYYGYGNAGDEAILAGMITALRELEPQLAVTVISGRAAATRQLHGVAAVSRDRYLQIWQAVGESDLVISGGGSLLQDVTGFKSVPYYLGIAAWGLMRRKPVLLYAQGIGPLRRQVSRLLVKWVANRVSAITVRDDESAALLRRLGVRRPPLHLAADAALALPPGQGTRGRELLAAAGLPPGDGPVVGVAVRPLTRPDGANQGAFAAAVGQALDQVAARAGARCVFIPMQASRDVPVAAAVKRHMQQPATLLTGDYTYSQVMDLVAACDLMVGMRYHSLVFAAMAGLPVVGLSYDPKNDHFLHALGAEPALRAAELDPPTLAAAVQAGLAGTPATEVRRLRLSAMADQARLSAQVAMDLLSGKGRGGAPDGE